MILNSPYISGSLTVTGNTNLIGALTVTGSLAGTATSSSFAYTASSAVSAYTAASAVNATTALTASYATSFTVGGTLTAQTLVVQTITSSVSFVTGSTRFGSLLTNTHTFTGSMFVTGSAINLSNSKIIIGDDGTYGGNISTVGFGGTSNGFNRIAAANNTSDGLYLIAATGRGIYFRPGGKSTQDLSVFPNGNTALGVNFLLPTATLHISGSGSGSLMQISSTVSSSIFFVSGSGNIGIGVTDLGPDGLSLATTSNYSWSEGSGNAYATLFRQRNSAATVMASGYKRSNTGNFASSYGISMARAAIAVGSNNGSIAFFSDPASNVANGTDIAPSERMTILNSGNVGIGTTSPQGALEVVGLSYFTRSSQTTLLNPNYGGAGTHSQLQVVGNMALAFATNGDNERMRITSGGEVGIGVTPTTGNRFWVRGSSTSSSDTSLFVQNSSPSSLFVVRNDGAVTTPLQPFAMGGLDGNQSISLNTFTTLNFSTSVGMFYYANVGNCWNNSTRAFTAPVTGTYLVNVSVLTNSIGQVALHVNGNRKHSIPSPPYTGSVTWGGSAMIPLSSGEVLTLQGYGNAGTVEQNTYHTFFAIYLLG